jgi:protein-L-isoaspartate(D-aspartate) O-methyltransferase
MNTEQARFNMIEQQIRPWDVLDTHILQLLSIVRREDFVPLAHKALAFVDMEIPLSKGGNQVMLAPRVEARMLQDLELQKHEKVLEIGSGSGYMAALLAHRAQRVVSLECDAALVQLAKANLDKAGVYNAEVRHADGAKPLPADLLAQAPFDAIVLSGSVAQVPPALLDLLKVGGRLAAIVGDEPMMRFTLVTKVADASFKSAQAWDTVAPRLLGFAQPSSFTF